MSTQKKTLRRSGAKIMASLIALLGSLSYIMILAVINGSVGFVCAMGVTVFGAVGVAKALGEAIALSYGWIIGLTIGCGVLRGLLRYFEQYSNHYIAFRLLAVLRDKIFGALRVLCPAKLESKQKGSFLVPRNKPEALSCTKKTGCWEPFRHSRQSPSFLSRYCADILSAGRVHGSRPCCSCLLFCIAK